MDALLSVLKPRARRYPLSLVYALGAVTALLTAGVGVDQVQRRTPKGWWSRNKASCNPVRVTAALRDARGQGGALSAGGPAADLYASTCLALAGQFAEADRLAGGLPPVERAEAARLFYRLGAPTDEAASARIAPGQLPIMELALKHSLPRAEDHLRAAYYVALAELEAGKPDDARRHLEDFLKAHPGDDAWRRTALDALAGLR